MVGKIRIADGTEGANKILTCDANGIARWEESPTVFFNCQVYNNNGTFSILPGVKKIKVEVWGGGGPGGKSGEVLPYTDCCTSGGGGGGGGGYGCKTFNVIEGNNYEIKIGIGGVQNDYGGTTGGTSSFGLVGQPTLINATGGQPGGTGSQDEDLNNLPLVLGGAGGIGGTSNAPINIPGDSGDVGQKPTIIHRHGDGGSGGAGANGGIGGIGASTYLNRSAGNGSIPGGGGGAGSSTNYPSAGVGLPANGANGKVIVWW